jgi:enamine deaminase RidA (YjgF/YER057c/UK114 family)
MIKIRNPAQLPTPTSYSHGIEVPGGSRTLYVAGQVGWNKDGAAAPGIVAQTTQAFENLRAILGEAGMDFENIVKTTVFLVNPEDFVEFARIRSSFLGAQKPASTLVFIKQLIQPNLLVEIEAVAIG